MLNFCFFLLLQISICLSSGKFEIELNRLINRQGVNINGTCCNGPTRFLTCLQPCKTFIRFCLRNPNPNFDRINQQFNNEHCTYSFDETPILGGNNIDFNRLTQQANLIVLPFKFSWMGDFVLQVDIFNDKSYDGQVYEGSARELIMSTIIRSSIWPNSSWHDSQTIDSLKEFSFRYRLSCSINFYGEQCSRFCSPLSIHSRCDTKTGELICQQGWNGNDCNKAICREGCQHGDCFQQPGQCICRNGWMGDQCHIDHEESMVGFQDNDNTSQNYIGLTNRALNTCESNPCLNSGQCVNLPSGKYRCQCSTSYTGYHCESSICPQCKNGGKCYGSRCICPLGYHGLLCEERLCLNGGLNSLSKCLCPPGYEGEQCQIESKCPICRNNGKCLKKKCVCTKDYLGQYCEINIQLIQKKEKKTLFSLEFILTIIFLIIFIFILISLSYTIYKYHYRREKQVSSVKIWTTTSTNIFQENEKIIHKKDINLTLKQTSFL